MTRHTYFLGFLAELLLVGCEKPVMEGQAEAIAYDAAQDATAGKFSDIESRIQELESEVADLESKTRSLESENTQLRDQLSSVETRNDWDKDSIDRLFGNDKTFASHLRIPVEQSSPTR